MTASRRPDAGKIATAIVAACKLTGDDPVKLIESTETFRARNLALGALHAAYPDAVINELGKVLNFWAPKNARVSLANARKASWWREDWVDEVVGALVADVYGDQAQ